MYQCNFECKRCGFHVEVKAEHHNMQDVVLNISSNCPNLDPVTQSSITLDAMYELMVPREKSSFMKLLDHHHAQGCTAYDGVIDAIGASLGRYFEIA